MSSLNLYNTIWAVIFPIVGWPFGVFLICLLYTSRCVYETVYDLIQQHNAAHTAD